MKRRWSIRLILAALVVWLAWGMWRQVEDDPILTLLYFMIGGVVAAVVVVKVVLARLADAIGNAVFLSGGPQTPETINESEAEENVNGGEAAPNPKSDAT